MLYQPSDGSLIYHIDPIQSLRLDSKVSNNTLVKCGRQFPALKFDGIDDKVTIPSDQLLGATECSICAWVFKTKYIPDQRVASNWGSEGPYLNWILGREYPENAIWFYVANGSVMSYIRIPGFDGGKWHFICGSFIGGDKLEIYLDGVNVSQSTTVSNIGTVNYNNMIGKYSTKYFKGFIGDVRYYTRCLTIDEKNALYHGEEIDNTGLVTWFNKNGAGSDLVDYSGNGNDGTISGAVWEDGAADGTLIGMNYKNSPTNTPVYNFDGVGYIRVSPVLYAKENMSVFIWAKAAQESYIIGQYDTALSFRSWIIGTDASNEKRMRVILSDNGTYSADHTKDYLTVNNVFDNHWHLYGFTWDNGTLKLYVDGQEQAVTKTYDAAFTHLNTPYADMSIGARLMNGVRAASYTGQTGHTWIHNRTMRPSEAMNLYNQTRAIYGR